MKNEKLTNRQEAFCIAYAAHFDGVRAAREAGYSEKSISSQASQLISHPKIKERVNQILDQFAESQEVLKHRVLNELKGIAFDVVSEDLKMTDKLKAIELLGKHLGLFKDVTVNNNTINVGASLKNQPDHVIIELAKESIKKLSEG